MIDTQLQVINFILENLSSEQKLAKHNLNGNVVQGIVRMYKTVSSRKHKRCSNAELLN